MTNPLRTAFSWTAPWVVVLVSLFLLASGSSAQFPYGFHAGFTWLGGLATLLVLFFGLWRASDYVAIGGTTRRAGTWFDDGHLLAVLAFWAMFPPCWFFVQHYALDHGLFALPAGTTDLQAYLASTEVYAGLASKVWAGAGALFVAVLAKAK